MMLTITLTCEQGHTQEFHTDSIDIDAVRMFVGLMDGTSSLYMYPPDATSPIGKCGICGSRIMSEIKQS